jgi:hypothetical protein
MKENGFNNINCWRYTGLYACVGCDFLSGFRWGDIRPEEIPITFTKPQNGCRNSVLRRSDCQRLLPAWANINKIKTYMKG